MRRALALAVCCVLLLAGFPAAAQLVGSDTAPGSSCSGFPTGATRVTADADHDNASVVLICDGTLWQAMSGAGGGGSIATDSDVALTSVANNDILRYDSSSSKWKNINIGTAMSTTTMVPNWPDAIKCNTNGGERILIASAVPHPNTFYYYADILNTGGVYNVIFNADGTFNSTTGFSSVGTCNGTIGAIYTAGRAFNFIGSSLASAASPSGGVQFNNGSGVLAADAALTWDNTNKRLGVGNTSPTVTLDVTGAAKVSGTLAVTGNVTLSGTGNSMGTITSGVWSAGAVTSSGAVTGTKFIPTCCTTGTVGMYLPAAGVLGFATNSAEQMRIDASGNVGIGTTSPTTKLDVRTTGITALYAQTDNTAETVSAYNTGANYAIHADSTSSYAIHAKTHVNSAAALEGYSFDDTSYGKIGYNNVGGYFWGTQSGYGVYGRADNDGTNISYGGYFQATGVGIGVRGIGGGVGVEGTVSTAGADAIYGTAGAASTTHGVWGNATGSGSYGVYCTGTTCGGNKAWTNTSDARLKTNIRSLNENDGLEAVMKLRPVRYHWKDADTDTKLGVQLGLIAQEVEPLFPEVVITDVRPTTITLADGKQETIEKPKAMQYSTLVVPIIKAVQELKQLYDGLLEDVHRHDERLEKLEAAVAGLKAANDNLRNTIAGQGRAITALNATNDNQGKEMEALRDKLRGDKAAYP